MATPGGWTGVLKFLKYTQRVRSSFGHFYSNGTETLCIIPRPWVIQCNMYAKDMKLEQSAMQDEAELNPKKQKVYIPRITLLSENDEVSVTTVEMADRLAKRRNLKLVKILDFDAKTERPTYKLMSTKEYLQEGLIRKKQQKLERESAIKPEKLVTLTTKISEHDLQIKLKSVVKFLNKRHEGEICTKLEEAVKDLSVTISKTKSKNKVKFTLLPKLEKKVPEASESEAKETKDETPVAAAS